MILAGSTECCIMETDSTGSRDPIDQVLICVSELWVVTTEITIAIIATEYLGIYLFVFF